MSVKKLCTILLTFPLQKKKHRKIIIIITILDHFQLHVHTFNYQ